MLLLRGFSESLCLTRNQMLPSHHEHMWTLIARKLSGEITAAEQEELEQLLHADPDGNYSMEILQDIFKSNQEPDRQYAENKYRELVLRLQNTGVDDGKFNSEEQYYADDAEPKPGNNSNRKKWLLIGLSLTVVVIMAVVFFQQKENKKNTPELMVKNEISTKNGSKTNLVLPDGSKVWLNAGSKLTYDKSYGTNLREVTLSGEAYFDVVKKPDMPFIIHTLKMDVKVLGTAFDVKCYPGEKTIETSLIRGSVEITLKDRPEKIVLKPNEKLIINDMTAQKENNLVTAVNSKNKAAIPEEPVMIVLKNITREPETNAVLETGWVENRLVFSSETFEEVAFKMQHWYGVNIQFTNEKLKQKKFTGIFENETVAQALAAMKLTTAFNYTINKDNIILSP
ncbi:MAG: FecR family protein [Ferruginibacter sp.]